MSCPGPLDTARIESDSGPEYEEVPTQASQRATEEIELKTPTHPKATQYAQTPMPYAYYNVSPQGVEKVTTRT